MKRESRPAVESPGTPAGELERAIAAEARDGRIPCAALFRIAAEREVAVAEVGRAVERLGIRIRACQLGCF